jgi:hypothetical protein
MKPILRTLLLSLSLLLLLASRLRPQNKTTHPPVGQIVNGLYARAVETVTVNGE